MVETAISEMGEIVSGLLIYAGIGTNSFEPEVPVVDPWSDAEAACVNPRTDWVDGEVC